MLGAVSICLEPGGLVSQSCIRIPNSDYELYGPGDTCENGRDLPIIVILRRIDLGLWVLFLCWSHSGFECFC